MKNQTIASGIIVFCIAVFFIVESLRMPKFGEFVQAPGFFPLVIGVLTFIFSIQLIIRGVRNRPTAQPASEEEPVKLDKEARTRILVIVGAMAVYVVLLSLKLPYFLITGLFLIGTLFYFHPGKKIQNLCVSVAVSVSLYLLFTKVFSIPLP